VRERQQIVVCVIGPTASGKGTQADLIATQLSGERVTIGRLLRDAMRSETSLGRMITQAVKHGTILGIKIIKPVLDTVMQTQQDKVLVLDGFPNTVDQAKLFLGYANEHRYILAVELMIDELTIKKRVMQRLKSKNYEPTAEDDLSILDDKLLLYELGKKQIRQVFVDGMSEGKHMNYFQTDGTLAVEDVHRNIMQFISQDLS
jgi:adenylate kinase